MKFGFIPVHDRMKNPEADDLLLLYRHHDLFLTEGSGDYGIPARGDSTFGREGASIFLGEFRGQNIWAAEASVDQSVPGEMGLEPINLREAFTLLDEESARISNLGRSLLNFERDHQYCGRCRSSLDWSETEWAKYCSKCKWTQYPRVSPAAIVLITRGDQMLLARNGRFRRPYFSALAGFVEAGESLEETIHREILEEVGVRLGRLHYFSSQPWSFPHSLMIGFIAEYASGDIQVDDDEIAEARWFTKDNLPLLPPPTSIARQMIDWFTGQQS